MDKISVIIPAYNAEKYVLEAIDSVINQTYKNIEIIIVNDGSTDNTYNILKEKKSNNPKLIKLIDQENQGQSASRNKALEYVSGEYIFFLDADDILVEDCLERLYESSLEKNADISICGYEKFYDNTGEIFYKRNPKDWEVFFSEDIKHVFHYSPCAKLFKFSLIKKFDLNFSVGEQLEDGPYSALADLLSENVVTLDYIGYKYRVYDESTMGNVRKKNHKPKPPFNGCVTVIEKFSKFNANPSKIEVMEFCVVKILAGFVTTLYKTCDNEDRKEICKQCHEIVLKYFPNIAKNPYIKINRLKSLPLTHRVAVRCFVFFDRINLLYPFSLIVSKVL